MSEEIVLSCKDCPYVIRTENLFTKFKGKLGDFASQFPVYQCSESEVKRLINFPNKIPQWCPKYYDELLAK